MSNSKPVCRININIIPSTALDDELVHCLPLLADRVQSSVHCSQYARFLRVPSSDLPLLLGSGQVLPLVAVSRPDDRPYCDCTTAPIVLATAQSRLYLDKKPQWDCSQQAWLESQRVCEK